MRSLEKTFGENAGKIWQKLNESGTLEKNDLLNDAQITEEKFYAGIGWLAREDKIFREGNNTYRLDNTNLTEEIGGTAGKIYKIMDVWGEADVPILKTLIDGEEKDVYSALGWLAREDKIDKKTNSDKYFLKEKKNK
ncbi:MAG: winged helix-turn-helix domain-containing protein [Candidatus Thermoplasmatota archaeon]